MMWSQPQDLECVRQRLAEICEQGIFRPTHPLATFDEPYSPYVPDGWNGILILSEAQNHSQATNSSYVAWLRSLSTLDRIQRLYRDPNGRGIQPWNDGSLPLALTAALGIEPDQCGLSNAVLWSVVDEKGNNASPAADLIARSAALWKEMLPVLQPRLIVAVGKCALRVITTVGEFGASPTPVLPLLHPSPLNRARLKRLLAGRHPLDDFPEVAAAAELHAEALQKTRDLKLQFAVHAVEAARALPA